MKFGRLIIGAAAVLAVLVTATATYKQYRLSLLKSKLQEAIGRDLAYTETILRVETESQNMKYAELFHLCDDSIDERTKLLIEVRGLYPEIRFELREKLADFLALENKLVRAKRAVYENDLRNANLSERDRLLSEREAKFTQSPPTEYEKEALLSDLNDHLLELKKLRDDMIRAYDDLRVSYLHLVEQETSLSTDMGSSGIKFPRIFEKYKASNLNRLAQEKTSEGAETIRKAPDSN